MAIPYNCTGWLCKDPPVQRDAKHKVATPVMVSMVRSPEFGCLSTCARGLRV